MPTYNMKHLETGEVKEMVLSLAEREELLATGDYEQMLSTPSFVSQHGSTVNKAGDGWKDTLKRIKAASSPTNTINT